MRCDVAAAAAPAADTCACVNAHAFTYAPNAALAATRSSTRRSGQCAPSAPTAYAHMPTNSTMRAALLVTSTRTRCSPCHTPASWLPVNSDNACVYVTAAANTSMSARATSIGTMADIDERVSATEKDTAMNHHTGSSAT